MATRQDRKTYDFKSVGNLSSKTIADRYSPEPVAIGITTPMQLGNGSNIFKMHYDLEKQISDNLRNLVLTNHGERLGRYDFGANIMELVFELGTDDFDQEAMMRIKNSVSKFMPFVQLEGFAVEIDHYDNKEVSKVNIFVTYTIPRISRKKIGLKVTMYSGG
jgi:phage baseplate assembly protein W